MPDEVTRDIKFFFRGRSAPGGIIKRNFSEEINKISEKFEKIYNEAKEAEERGLEEICGAGYRKALEFLIKDYLIKQKADKGKVIKETGLGKSIDDYIKDTRIKDCAKRAAWIGNELTHYYRRWEDKDLQDLRNLLELTVHWIEMESLSKKYKKEMPEKKTKGKK